MPVLENVERITFTVETLVVREGQKLARLQADENGYYNDFPVAVLGVSTRNKTYYDVSEFVAQITEPNTYLNQMIADGTLYGEYGHPNLTNLDHGEQINRLAVIDENRISHHFRKIQTSHDLESGGRLITADIKPTGPYGKFLKENLDEPFMNTAFSLRSITQDRMEGDIRRRKMRKLVTFDAVAAGGYAEASKRFMPSKGALETIDVTFNSTKDALLFNECALESFADTEIAEIFKTDKIFLQRRVATLLKGTGVLKIEGEKDLASLYHSLVRP